MLPERRKFFSEQQRNLFEQGAEQGKALGRIEGRAEGRVEGWIEGRAEGRVEGLLEGMLEAKADMLLRLIKQREWAITEAQRRRIVDCTEMVLLNRWLDRMLPAISVDNLLT
jgi:flagellar biosynthesis/type III secretory pathway protein FliH